jgi:hypothetical protein
VGPDGTVYVGDGSTVEIINRFQGSINWGSNNGAVSATQTLTLYNGGNQPLTISSITSSGTGYTVAPATTNGCTNGITLAPGTVCQFLVTSTPPHAGTLTGAVTITSNSLNEPGTVQTVALTGYTSGIWVAATPNPYVFPAQTAGTTSVPLPVTVTNTSVGSSAVGYGSTVAITSGFTSTNSAFTASLGDPTAPTYCGNPLPTGATCLIQVTFNPSQATSYSGTISWYEQITGAGPSMKVSVAVSGNGTPVPLMIPISETVHFTDSDVVTPSLLIPISETVHFTDSDVPTPSLLIPVNETIHVTDTEEIAGQPTSPPPPATLSSPTPGATLTGSSTTFGWTHVTGATGYLLSLGSTGVGSANLYYSGSTTATSVTATGLPTNGETIYARLLTNFNGTWAHVDYTFTAEAGAALTTPAPGSILTASSMKFTWTSATGATGYLLELGSTGVGSYNLYYSGSTTATSVTATDLPTNGETIYARLLTNNAGTWVHSDYVYTAVTQAAVATPTPGATLTSSSTTFSWTSVTGATGYLLSLGSTGAGSTNLYYSGSTTNTSTTVSGLPINGETIYARLFTNNGGTWLHTDYTYKAVTEQQAVLTTPTPASTLTGSSTTFSWASAPSATGYILSLGSTGAGSTNLYYSGSTTNTSVNVTGLPINGETIYARLFTQLNGTWVHTDYMYTAATEAQAVLTTPTPSSTLTGSAVTFTWTSAPSATGYILALGSTGAGSSNLFYSGATTATSATVTKLPTNGETIYARLFTQLNGTWVHTDSTYTAAP